MTFDADALRTGAMPDFVFQDAQEVPACLPFSSAELLAALRSSAPLDVHEVREAFASLMQQVNCAVCFLVAAEQAVRAVHSPLDEDLPLPIVRAVQAALVAPTNVFNRVETHTAYSHVLPEVESALNALSEDGIADRAQLASDVEALVVSVHMQSFSSTFAVFNYVNEILSTIVAHRAVPALPPGFQLNGIPLHRYTDLGHRLLAAL
jgi:hypothetical protein